MHMVNKPLIVLLLAALYLFPTPLSPTSTIAHVSAQSDSLCMSLVTLNLYPGPGTSSGAPIGQIAPSTALSILAYSVDEAWMLVTVNQSGEQGWISAVAGLVSCDASVSPVEDEPTTPPTPVPTTSDNRTANTQVDGATVCSVTVTTLNLRPGPGTQYEPPVAKLARGTQLIVLSTLDGSSWIEVQVSNRGDTGWINGSSDYVNCGGAGASSSQSNTSQSNTGQSNTGNSQNTVATAPGLVTNFESWGTWQRGDETWGTFTQSQSRSYDGSYAGELRYAFPANTADNYVVFLRSLPMSGQPLGISAWVYGDGSGNFLNVWVQDANSNLWQFGMGRVFHTGWQEMVAPFDLQAGWPNQAISAGATRLTYPLRFHAFVFDAPDNAASSGVIYIDGLTALDDLPSITTTGSSSTGSANNTGVVPTGPTPTPTPTPLPAQIAFRADDTTLEAGECTVIRWDVENVQAVFFDGDGVTGHETRTVCPDETETYTLRVQRSGGTESYQVTVEIDKATAPAGVANAYVGEWYALDFASEIDRVVIVRRGEQVDISLVYLCVPMSGCVTTPSMQAKWNGSGFTVELSGPGTTYITTGASGLQVQTGSGSSSFGREYPVSDPN